MIFFSLSMHTNVPINVLPSVILIRDLKLRYELSFRMFSVSATMVKLVIKVKDKLEKRLSRVLVLIPTPCKRYSKFYEDFNWLSRVPLRCSRREIFLIDFNQMSHSSKYPHAQNELFPLMYSIIECIYLLNINL
jgi:hypothetical protein